MRAVSYESLFKMVGFDVETEINLTADPEYFEDFLARLKNSQSPFLYERPDDLASLGVLFKLTRLN
jgi:hypothetical protein